MHIEELKGEEGKLCGGNSVIGGASNVGSDAKRVLVGAGARALFYPSLLYNVVRNKIQAEFRWWDKVDEFILLGAVLFPIDVPRLKELGVRGFITLNESYETLVPTTLYYAHGIDHLVIPTRDYCFAPSLHDICHAVDFTHAYHYVKSIWPRVLLASSQWQAVQEYYHLMVRRAVGYVPTVNLFVNASEATVSSQDLVTFDDGSVVVVTESDLEGYNDHLSLQSGTMASEIWGDLSVGYHLRVAGQAALARISCPWMRCGTPQKTSAEKQNSCSIRTNHLGGISVDIHVY